MGRGAAKLPGGAGRKAPRGASQKGSWTLVGTSSRMEPPDPTGPPSLSLEVGKGGRRVGPKLQVSLPTPGHNISSLSLPRPRRLQEFSLS